MDEKKVVDETRNMPPRDRRGDLKNRMSVDLFRRRVGDRITFQAGDQITTSGRRDQIFNEITANGEILTLDLNYPKME